MLVYQRVNLIRNLQAASLGHPPVAQHQVIALQTARRQLTFEVVEGFKGPEATCLAQQWERLPSGEC